MCLKYWRCRHVNCFPQDFVKISKWNDVSFWSIKQSVEKTHRWDTSVFPALKKRFSVFQIYTIKLFFLFNFTLGLQSKSDLQQHYVSLHSDLVHYPWTYWHVDQQKMPINFPLPVKGRPVLLTRIFFIYKINKNKIITMYKCVCANATFLTLNFLIFF